jgi:hypothetical protein
MSSMSVSDVGSSRVDRTSHHRIGGERKKAVGVTSLAALQITLAVLGAGSAVLKAAKPDKAQLFDADAMMDSPLPKAPLAEWTDAPAVRV